MRYLIHLLPEESRRADLDALRARLAEHIGWNKALDYPTTHITMVYDIQDAKNVAHPIDRVRLQLALQGTVIALLARDFDVDEPYRLAYRVAL